MGENSNRRRGFVGVAFAVIAATLLAGCANQVGQPAPVFDRTNGPMAGNATPPPGPPHRETRKITVQPGQSVSILARTYHVPERDIIAANHLTPPYALKAGATLLLPDAGPPPVQQATGPIAAAPGVTPPTLLAPPAGASSAPPPGPPPPSSTTAPPDIVPLDGPPPKQAITPPPPAPPSAPPPTPPPAAAPAAAEPPPTTPSGAPPVLAPRNPAAALPLPGEQLPAAPGDVAATGRFPWPVRGRVLATFGITPGGGHNDGINIAAPRGTPVRAIEAGVVAYAGNEVKGYGNLVLIKHADGWISAYAHLDEIVVKVGDNITGGQVIAKVGNSGGVAEPQLHFELRQGKKPVDPRQFLAPVPSAA